MSERVVCPACLGETYVFFSEGKRIPQRASMWAFALGEDRKKCPLCSARGKVSSALAAAFLVLDSSDLIATCKALRFAVPDLFEPSLLDRWRVLWRQAVQWMR